MCRPTRQGSAPSPTQLPVRNRGLVHMRKRRQGYSRADECSSDQAARARTWHRIMPIAMYKEMNMAARTSRQGPRVSLGMPVYNAERYLEEALGSVLGQSFDDFELVISDNASTDRTGDICRAYATRDERIKYFRMRQNYGVI